MTTDPNNNILKLDTSAFYLVQHYAQSEGITVDEAVHELINQALMDHIPTPSPTKSSGHIALEWAVGTGIFTLAALLVAAIVSRGGLQ